MKERCQWNWERSLAHTVPKTTPGDQDPDNTMSYDDACAVAWKGRKAGTGSGTKGTNGTGTWNRGKGYDRWQVGKVDDWSRKGGKKVSKGGSVGSKYDRCGRGTRYSGSKGKGKGKGKTHSQHCFDRGEQGHISVDCPHKWTNNVDEDDHPTETKGPPWRMKLREGKTE